MLRIGVTGTNGKSSTCTWLARALESTGQAVGRVRNDGYTLGEENLKLERSWSGFMAFNQLAAERGAIAIVAEITSLALQNGIGDLWPCHIAVLTNVTHDHLNIHRDLRGYAAAKKRVFDSAAAGATAIANRGDPISREIVGALREDLRVRSFGWSRPDPRDLFAVTGQVCQVSWTRSPLLIEDSASFELPVRIDVPASGEHFAENAMAAWIGAVAAGADADAAAAAIAGTDPPPGRLESVHAAPRVLVDYGHNPDAIRRTLKSVRALTSGKIIAVLGAGGGADTSKRGLMGAAASDADKVFVTSDNTRGERAADIAAEVRSGVVDGVPVELILCRRDAVRVAVRSLLVEDCLVIFGRGAETSLIVDGLEVKGSDATFVLEALDNLNLRRT